MATSKYDRWKCTTKVIVSRDDLERALTHTLNYHGIDARLHMTDMRIAQLLLDETWKWFCGETDAQILEKMTPEERSRIGLEDR